VIAVKIATMPEATSPKTKIPRLSMILSLHDADPEIGAEGQDGRDGRDPESHKDTFVAKAQKPQADRKDKAEEGCEKEEEVATSHQRFYSGWCLWLPI
jgi:hypothetical protein